MRPLHLAYAADQGHPAATRWRSLLPDRSTLRLHQEMRIQRGMPHAKGALDALGRNVVGGSGPSLQQKQGAPMNMNLPAHTLQRMGAAVQHKPAQQAAPTQNPLRVLCMPVETPPLAAGTLAGESVVWPDKPRILSAASGPP